ncbi:MAG: CotH kinase family protein [Bacteroidales bacterium]|nr:CotH kinase family protein [Bacteroidales bacterium]
MTEKLKVLAVIFLLAAAVSCGKDRIEEKTGPVAPAEVTFTADVIAHIDILTDGGAAVDSKDPKNYRPCTVKVSGEESYALEARGKIRGRGNSTWNWYPKKPYRIKLDASAPFLGMAPNKDWVLLADYRDVTHMMNLVGFYLAHGLGLPYANNVRYATVTLNGEDLGLYMVTEQVEEGGHRVKLDPEEGILLALDINDGPDDEPRATDNFFSDVYGMAAAVKYPEDAGKAGRNRVREELAFLERAIGEGDWTALQRELDVASMAKYILIQEIISNVEMDNYPSLRSGFIHRYDDDSPWVMGPLWDCDGGFNYNWGDMYDHRGRGHTYFENYRTLIFGTDPYYHEGAYGSTPSDFFCDLFGIPEFVSLLQQVWSENQAALLSGLLDCLEEQEALIGEAAQADMDRWGIDRYSHAEEYRKLRTWLTNRFHYLDGVIRKYPKY